VLDALAACERERRWPDVFVVELSSYQLETTGSLALAAATVLNVTENHLDRYPGMDAYAAAKERIFAHAAAQVLPREDARCLAMRRARLPGASFGAGAPGAQGEWGLVGRDGESWLARWTAGACVPLVRTSALQLVGRHNALNALAALALAELAGCDPQPLVPALAAFRGLPHRMTRIAERRGVIYIDDSKATTVAAAIAALEGLGRPAVLIAGGDGKGQDFRPLAEPVDRHCRAVMVLGRDAPAISTALRDCTTPVITVASLEQAVRTAAGAARAGDAVLLSPACASLDMFRDFAHRGDAFAAACAALDGEAVDA
jgi:UDP-N-acetylmuramoylalanine--D-glutamate ligase